MVNFVDLILNRLHLPENREKIVRNLIWSVLGKVVNLLGGLLVGVIVARYLGTVQYGVMNYVIGFVALFQPFAMFGLDSIEVREESRGVKPYQTILGTAFGLKVVLALCFMSMLITLSFLIESDKEVIVLIMIYSLSVLFNSANVMRNYFISLVKNEYVVKSEINRTVVGMLIKVVLLYMNAPLFFFIIAYTFDVVLLASGYLYSYNRHVGSVREWRWDTDYAKYLLKESFPLVLTYAAVVVYQRIDQVMIGNIIDKESVGYFSVASKFVEILMFVSVMLVQTITPILVQCRERSQEEYEKKGQMFLNVSFWLSVICASLMFVCSTWIVRYTYGEHFMFAVTVLQVLCFKALGVSLSSVGGAMIVIEGLQRYAVLRDVLGCVCCVVLNNILLPRYGVVAAAFVAILSNLFAGYVSGLFIPVYRHIFIRQTKAVLFGWKDIVNVKSLLGR